MIKIIINVLLAILLLLGTLVAISLVSKGTTINSEPYKNLAELYNSDEFKELYYRFFSSGNELDLRLSYLSRFYGVSNKLVRAIISCESNFKADAINYKAKVGKDIGYFQINSYYHQQKALAMNLDIFNPDDNLEYGFYLLKKEGTKPWRWSKKCQSAQLNLEKNAES